jgi:hypothetical protein
MLTPKRFLLVAALLVAGGGSAVVLWLSPRPQRVTADNAQRIHQGMARAEVEAILGESGDYRTRPTHRYIYGVSFGPRSLAPWDLWEGDDIDIEVQFDDLGHVAQARSWPVVPTEMGVAALLRWRAERTWHRWTSGR